jgi:hypothetical protein
MVAPALVGVPVSAGDHDLTIRYQPFPYYPELLLLGLLVLAALQFGPRLRERVQRARGRGDPQPAG